MSDGQGDGSGVATPGGGTANGSSAAAEIPKVVFLEAEGSNPLVTDALRAECERNGVKYKVTKEVDLQNMDTAHQVAFYNCELAILNLRTVNSHASTNINFHIGLRRTRNMSPSALTIILMEQRVMCPMPDCTYCYYKMREGRSFADTADAPLLTEYLSHKLLSAANPKGALQTMDIVFQDGIARASAKGVGRDTKLIELQKLETILKDNFSDNRLHDILSCYRDIKEWNRMIRLAESAGDVLSLESRALLAFALNRRNKDGDRPRAMSICKYILQQLKPSKDGQQDTRPRKLLHDVHGLMGRIHKDAFIESLHESHRTGKRADYTPCDQAIKAYGQICQIEEEEAQVTGKKNNFYGAINQLTLMFCSNKWRDYTARCCELSAEISRAYGVNDMQPAANAITDNDYWALANVLEANVVSYYINRLEGRRRFEGALALALFALERMQDTSFEPWMAETTMRNIRLLDDVVKNNRRWRPRERTSDEEKLEFWKGYLEDCGSDLQGKLEMRVLCEFNAQQQQRPQPAHVSVHGATDTCDPVVKVHLLRPGAKDNPPFEVPITELKNIAMLSSDSDSASQTTKTSRTAELIVIRQDEGIERIFLIFPSQNHRSVFKQMCTEKGYVPKIRDDLQMSADAPINYRYNKTADGQRKVLGKGASATVYEGFDENSNQKLAIKVFKDDHTRLFETERRYANERVLQHRNIVQLCGFVREPTGAYVLLTELVPGGCMTTLAKYFGGLLDFKPWLKCYTAQIVEAVSYLHGMGVMHRDIKGDNVLVNTYTGVVKLADFNVARSRHGDVSNGGIAGAFHFMAPEVVDNEAVYKSDIWSLATTVWQMVTGRLPYRKGDRTVFEMRENGDQMGPEIEPTWDEDLRDFFDKCFQEHPDARPSAEDLKVHPFIRDNMELVQPRHTGAGGTPNGTAASTSSSSSLQVLGSSEAPPPRSRSGSVDASWTVHHERTITQSLVELLKREDVMDAWQRRLSEQQVTYRSIRPEWKEQLPIIRDFLLELLTTNTTDGDGGRRQLSHWRRRVRDAMTKLCIRIQDGEQDDVEDEQEESVVAGADAPHLTRQLVTRGVENVMRNLDYFELDRSHPLSILIPFMKSQEMKPHWVFFISQVVSSKCRILQDEMVAAAAVFFNGENKRTAATADDTDESSRSKRMRDADFAASATNATAPQAAMAQQMAQGDGSPFSLLINQQMILFDQWQMMAQNAKQTLAALQRELRPNRHRTAVAAGPPDPKLQQFVRDVGLPKHVLTLLAAEGITLDILLTAIEKDDLRELDLSLAERAVLWRAVCKRRAEGQSNP